MTQRLQQEAPALLETLPLLPDLLLNRLRQGQAPTPKKNPEPAWTLPVALAGTLALGAGLALSSGGTVWLVIAGGCLLAALTARHR